MREIKFKARNTINGNWVYGYYYQEDGVNKIHSGHTIYPVHPKTVSEYIGLYDLYENDIVELENWNPKRYVIKFIEGGFCLADIKTGEYVADICFIHHAGKVQYKTVGNIYQNNELLK